MKRDIRLEINGQAVDLMPDTSFTLNYNSSILDDIGGIKCNGSQTITLPRTLNNDRIMDMALLPSYDSSVRGVVLPCRCYVDGITLFDDGQCHLLDSSGDVYEIVITWGLLQEFSTWLNEKKKLTELNDDPADYIKWDSTVRGGEMGGVSQIEDSFYFDYYSLHYWSYYVGIEMDNTTRQWCNIHPCVNLMEIWERIRRENNLPFKIGSVAPDMETKWIVLVKNKNSSLQTMTETKLIRRKIHYLLSSADDDVKRLSMMIDADWYDGHNARILQKGYGQVVVQIPNIKLTMRREMVDSSSNYYQQSAADFFTAVRNTPSDYQLVIKSSDGSTSWRITPTVTYREVMYPARTLTFDTYMGEDNDGKPLAEIYIEIKKWSSVPYNVWENSNSGAYTTSWAYCLRETFEMGTYNTTAETTYMDYSYENNNNDYPLARFSLVPNLPDIAQIDFVKFICNFYGLFPVKRDNGNIDFVRFDVLTDNIDNGNVYDWSDKMVLTHDDAPQSVAFTLDGYARQNAVRYKEDKNDPIDNTAYIVVEDETLEREKNFVEFPFAASHGNRIPQYTLNEEQDGVEVNDVEYRLMSMSYSGDMRFEDSMTPRQIINRNYSALQAAVRKPIVIEGEILLNEIDLQGIDYTKPVYLMHYGRYYAIISIQWTSNEMTSKVKLLQIR